MAQITRREFNSLLAFAGAAGMGAGLSGLSRNAYAAGGEDLYSLDSFGDIRLLHFTDCHAQLLPIYFREPNVNIGVGDRRDEPPHMVGDALLKRFGLTGDPQLAHAYTYLDFAAAAENFGKIGGFAHIKTLVDRLRGDYGPDRTLLMDGGDTWQGSGTALWSRGKDMIEASNLLGVDVMTGHWEFTYNDTEVLENIETVDAEFLAQNVRLTEEAQFDDFPAWDIDSGLAFKPYSMRTLNGRRIAVIGQAFPYTPIANPSRFIPNWTFGIQDESMQALVDNIRENEKPDAVVLLSHNGMDVDVKMASIVSGIDAIFGGHTHDGVPGAIEVKNSAGRTLVTNAGSNGKFLAVMDIKIGSNGIDDYRHRLLPVFSQYLPADKDMTALIDSMREAHVSKLEEPLAVTDRLLYRRGNFNGSFDQVVCDALIAEYDAQISLSPGFRWGTSVLPGQTITMEHVLDQTAITYPETYMREMTGAELKLILEDVADNLFNPDPYRQQGGDMVRLGGMNYVCDVAQNIGSRISELQLDDGTLIEAEKSYKVAGWATVGSQSEGRPIWDVVADYLRSQKNIKLTKLNTPVLKGVEGNEGIADYPA